MDKEYRDYLGRREAKLNERLEKMDKVESLLESMGLDLSKEQQEWVDWLTDEMAEVEELKAAAKEAGRW